MQDAATIERIRRKFDARGPGMEERMRRPGAAAVADELGRGGGAAATGRSRTTIPAGLRERRDRADPPTPPSRRASAAGAAAPSA